MSLAFATLWVNSADDKLMIFFSCFFPESRIWHFMGDNLHEISKPIFWKNKEIFQNVVCWNFYSACKAFTGLVGTFGCVSFCMIFQLFFSHWRGVLWFFLICTIVLCPIEHSKPTLRWRTKYDPLQVINMQSLKCWMICALFIFFVRSMAWHVSQMMVDVLCLRKKLS